MKPSLVGKKLLIIGASPDELSLVARAQELGVFVIVTDRNLDHAMSPCKDTADEYWDIDWSDVNALEKKCREVNVDGVIAGYSEFRVENTIRLCERLGLPCYINMNQLDITRDKIMFKNCCRKNGVPVIHEYPLPEDVDRFPVIVKPTDRAGSIGISVAADKEELDKAYAYALECSPSKSVIIEDFISDAIKFDSYYSIINGEIELLSTDDVFNSAKNGLERVVQNGWVLPSIHHEAYVKKVDFAIRRMIIDMGIQNGYIFFSGFATADDEFSFFECGFRLCGGHLYNYFPEIGHVNNMDLFLFHALTGDAACIKEDVKPGRPFKNVTINVYSKAGTLAHISGFDKLYEIPDCRFALQIARVGQKCEDDKAILSKIGEAYFCSESADDLARDVERMYEIISATDENGCDMIYDRVTAAEIVEHWK